MSVSAIAINVSLAFCASSQCEAAVGEFASESAEGEGGYLLGVLAATVDEDLDTD
jgi:hypothetical protein